MVLERLRRALGLGGRKQARPEFAERVRRRAGGVGLPPFPGHSIETFKRMRQDPQIALGLALLKAPVVGLRWWVEEGGKRKPEGGDNGRGGSRQEAGTATTAFTAENERRQEAEGGVEDFRFPILDFGLSGNAGGQIQNPKSKISTVRLKVE